MCEAKSHPAPSEATMASARTTGQGGCGVGELFAQLRDLGHQSLDLLRMCQKQGALGVDLLAQEFHLAASFAILLNLFTYLAKLSK